MSKALFRVPQRMPQMNKRFPALPEFKLRCNEISTQKAIGANNIK